MSEHPQTVTVVINGQPLEVPKNITVLQACQLSQVEVPVFCYHPKLTVAGNCRMCLVQVGKMPKPVASCAMPVAEGMEIFTNTDMVHKARKGVLEFLLINHPLDCPICDQGGECDLQDITLAYGSGKSRYTETKRAVPNPDLGPLIKTVMNRCIHCMRCVRFGKEVAGVPELGSLGRGEDTEVVTVVGQAVTSELSGNMIDICPVGALTAKPYAFEGRPWEFTQTPSIDVHDAVGSNIRVDTRGLSVMRILPRSNDALNEDWISDKVRFSYDGLKRQRLDRCYVRREGRLVPVSPQEALKAVKEKIEGGSASKMGILAGQLSDLETLYAFKQFAESLKITSYDCRMKEEYLPVVSSSADYTFNTPIERLEEADVCLIVGSHVRYEAPLINARLRKAYLHNNLTIGVIGEAVDLTYPYEHLADDFSALNVLEETHSRFVKALKEARNPIIIVGAGCLQHPQGAAIYAQVRRMVQDFKVNRPDWHGFNFLPLEASRVGALDMGFYCNESSGLVGLLKEKKIDLLFSVGGDELDPALTKNVDVIYFGHHGDQGAQSADIILPIPAFHEKEGHYVNVEGRTQKGHRALMPLGEAQEEWMWVSHVLDSLGKKGFDSMSALKAALFKAYPALDPNHFQPRVIGETHSYKAEKIPSQTFASSPIKNFYRTNVIARASETMAKCVEAFGSKKQQRTGTHG